MFLKDLKSFISVLVVKFSLNVLEFRNHESLDLILIPRFLLQQEFNSCINLSI